MLIDKTINEPSEDVGRVLDTIIAMQKEAEKRAEELIIARSFGMARPGKQRHGITTNKGHGASKAKRKMAKKSRRINRKAA